MYRILGTTAVAGGLAIINSIGNISGYAGPQAVGLLHDLTGAYEVPLVVNRLAMAAAALGIFLASRAAAEPAICPPIGQGRALRSGQAIDGS